MHNIQRYDGGITGHDISIVAWTWQKTILRFMIIEFFEIKWNATVLQISIDSLHELTDWVLPYFCHIFKYFQGKMFEFRILGFKNVILPFFAVSSDSKCSQTENLVNSLRPSDAFMHRYSIHHWFR